MRSVPTSCAPVFLGRSDDSAFLCVGYSGGSSQAICNLYDIVSLHVEWQLLKCQVTEKVPRALRYIRLCNGNLPVVVIMFDVSHVAKFLDHLHYRKTFFDTFPLSSYAFDESAGCS